MKLGKSQREKDPKQVASVAAFRADGKVLMGRRRDSGKWNFPGGHLNPGEKPERGAIRELLEETGLKAKDLEKLTSVIVSNGRVEVHSYRATVDGDPDSSRDPDEEMDEFRWVNPDELPEEILANLHNKRDVTLEHLQDADLEKSGVWRSKDGIAIPRTGTNERLAWDQQYHQQLVQVFGQGQPEALKPLRIPTAAASGTNMPVNKDRLNLYRRMAHAGDRLPPVVVRRSGQGYVLVDGNHRQVAAQEKGVPELDAYEIVPLKGPPVRKFEDDVGRWLAKATLPWHFKHVARAVSPEGRRMVDHTTQLNAHPPEHHAVVEHYQNEVLNGPKPYEPKKAKDGITRKVIFETRHEPQGDLFNPSRSAIAGRFMVKPYHEGVVKRVRKWQEYPIQGWAEMTHQALYHAAGIGHLHQRVHVAEHNMGAGHEKEPALVVHMAHGFKPVYGASNVYHDPVTGLKADVPIQFTENAKKQVRHVALMDFLTNNLDRHAFNLMVNSDGNDILAIDHSRSFQYINTHQHKREGRKAARLDRELTEQFAPYAGRFTSGVGHVDGFSGGATHYADDLNRLEAYKPIFDWWGQVSQKVKDTFEQHLQHIKDEKTRDHLRRNFKIRAAWLDDRANMGLENFGSDWHRDHVRQFHPDQVSEEELDARETKRLQEEYEREQKAKAV